MSLPILQVHDLTKTFVSKKRMRITSSFTAVNPISFHLNQGEILGILGPNGAGKTTTIQMLIGALTPSSGSIIYFGQDFKTHRSEILESVAHASGYHKLPGYLTIEQNLEIFGRIYGLSKQQRLERIEELLEFFGIAHLRKKRSHTLSAGQMTRLILVKAFLPNPKIVLLDEPTASLDPDIAYETRQFILKQQKQFNVSIILTSHNMAEVSEVCNRVLVIKDGRIVAENTPKKLAQSVALSKLVLNFEKNEQAKLFLSSRKLNFEERPEGVVIEVEEDHIASILIAIAEQKLLYSHIEVIKPSLEHYFLHIAKRQQK